MKINSLIISIIAMIVMGLGVACTPRENGLEPPWFPYHHEDPDRLITPGVPPRGP